MCRRRIRARANLHVGAYRTHRGGPCDRVDGDNVAASGGSLFGKVLRLSGRRAHQDCECCQLEQEHGVSPTPSFPSRIRSLWAAKADGAGDRNRTGDIQLGKLALPSALLDKGYQESAGCPQPPWFERDDCWRTKRPRCILCTPHPAFRRKVDSVDSTTFDRPARLELRARRSGLDKPWSGRRGSNPQPTAWEAATLPLSYSRPVG